MRTINPRYLCRLHLQGEYREMFTFVGTLRKRKQIFGYIKNNLVEPRRLKIRYRELKTEMLRRGYHPKKKFKFNLKLLRYLPRWVRFYKIDKKKCWKDFIKCNHCKRRYNESKNRIERKRKNSSSMY